MMEKIIFPKLIINLNENKEVYESLYVYDIYYIYENFDELTTIFEIYSNIIDIFSKLNPIIKNTYIQIKQTQYSL